MRELNNIPDLFNDQEPNFVINDIELHIPPTAISVHKEGLEYAWKTLRSKVSTKIASGNGNYHVQVSITFAPDSLILLHRLISQVRNNPFVAIQNSFINGSISETHAIATNVNYFTLFGLNITNHPSSPGAFLVELDLRYFNYKPFGRSLTFKKDYSIKVEDGKSIKEYVHAIFPTYKNGPDQLQPVLKHTRKIKDAKRSSRNVGIKGGDLSVFAKRNSKNQTVVTDPRKSNAYKRYSNFLQLKYLNESFGINVVKGTEDPENFIPNEVFISKELYNMFQGASEATNSFSPNVIGLHELKVNKIKNEELLKFRRDLTHSMLLSGLNTRIVTKEYKSLTLGGNFLFRYRKSLRKGILKGMNEEEQNKVIRKNRQGIFRLFENYQEKSQKIIDKAKPIVSGLSLSAPNDRDLRLAIDPLSQKPMNALPLQRAAYYSPGSSVFIAGTSKTGYKVQNTHKWDKNDSSKLAFSVLTIRAGKIDYNSGGEIVITNGSGAKEEKIVYSGVQEEENLRYWIEAQKGKVFPAGTIVGYFDTTNEFTINASGQLINDLCLTLTGKALEEKYVASSKVVKRAVSKVSLGKGNETYLTEKDLPYINSIKRVIEEEGFSQYQYRSGLENVFQKALILSFDSNLFEEDIKAITGKDTFGVNSDSFPKFEQDITNVSCSLRNIISSIPILGYAYPTHQFLGSIEPSYQFNFIGYTAVGDGLPEKIKELENIRAHTAYMAKNFPQIPDAANIVVESLITKLVGSFKYADNDEKVIQFSNKQEGVIRDIKPRFLISSADTFTIEGSPGAAGLNLRFSESKSYDEEEVRAAKSSEIDENYLSRYASVIQQGGINIGAKGLTQNSYKTTSYSTAKYVNNYWNTIYFGSKSFYAHSKGHLRKRIKSEGIEKILVGEIDKNAFEFCKDYLDPLQKFLNIYLKHRRTSGSNPKNFAINAFSTLDRELPGESRGTASNHFTGGAADIYINNMNVCEAAAIIELLEERRFFFDSIGRRKGMKNRKRIFGIGIYGRAIGGTQSRISGDGPAAAIFNNNLMPKTAGSFIHLDVNFIVTHGNKNGSSWKVRDKRRRWGGKDDEFHFVNQENFWNNEIGIIKAHIRKNGFDTALKEYYQQQTQKGVIINGQGYEIDTKGLFEFENFTQNEKINIQTDHIPGQIGSRPRDLRSIKFIMLHHGGHNAEFLKRTWAGTTTSSHFGISYKKDGTIVVSQMVDVAYQANHAREFNRNSIGFDFALSPVTSNAKRYGFDVIDNPGPDGPRKILKFPDELIQAACHFMNELHRIVPGIPPQPSMFSNDETVEPNLFSRNVSLQTALDGGYTILSHSHMHESKYDVQYLLPRIHEEMFNGSLPTNDEAVEEATGLDEDEIEEASEGDVAKADEAAPKEDTRESSGAESANVEAYKLTSTKPEDLIMFLRRNRNSLNLTEDQISSIYKTTSSSVSSSSSGGTGMYGGGVKMSNTSTEYLFEISQTGNKYEIKFFPPKGQKQLTREQEAVIKAIKNYYGKELKVNVQTSAEYGTKTIRKPIPGSMGFDRHSGIGRVEFTSSVVTDTSNLKSKSLFFNAGEVSAGTAQRDAVARARLNNNKMLKGFTELASLMLTEPYLYTDSVKEFEDEMRFIQKELHGFPVLPTFYTTIEQLFTGSSSLGAGNEYLKFVKAENITKSKSPGQAIGSGIGLGISAYRLGKTLATRVNFWAIVADASFAIFEMLGIWDALVGNLGEASKSQLKRVRTGIIIHGASLSYKESFKSYSDYFLEHKDLLIGETVKLSNKGKNKTGNFLNECGSAEKVQGAINNHIKPIFSELSIFKNFNEVAASLDSSSRALNLIRRSLKDSKGLYDEDGKIDANLANFALAERLTTGEIKNYLTFLFTFPLIDDARFMNAYKKEEDHDDIIEVEPGGRPGFVRYKESAHSNTYPYIWIHTPNPAPIKYDPSRYSSEFIGYNSVFNKLLYDVSKFPYLLTYQVNYANGIKAYFENIKGKEKLKSENRVKLAYLKKLLSAILEEHMSLNPEIVEKSKDATLLRVLDGSTVFELLEENAYPDVDLPQDPENPYNNSNLSPCFYYHDSNDTLDAMVASAKEKELEAANKILDSSIQFQKGLRNGIFTGPESKLKGDQPGAKLVEEIVDSTEVLRSVSEFMITGKADEKRAAYIAPIKVGMFNNTTGVGETSYTEVTVNQEFISNNKNAVAAVRRYTKNALDTANSKFNSEYEKEFSRLSSAFGSALGFKMKDDFLQKLKESEGEELKRTLGDQVEQDYGKEAIKGLSEDSSKNIYKLKTMKNAFPTFRLYLVEEDEIYTDRLTAFDDFFYYNSVISFNVHNSRELAASTATIQLQNISGLLDGTKKRVLRDVDLDPNVKEDHFKKDGNFIDTIVLRPGVTVQLRAGYESNTNDLDVLISGKIVDINYAQNNTICNITVQSFGTELTALRKGNGGKDNNNANAYYSTHQLLGSMMLSDELKHFGRSKVGAVFQIGEYKDFSLDLDIYKKESSFNFSLSRGFFDWVRDNTFGIGIGVGLLTFGMPLLKMGARTKFVSKITSWYASGTGKSAAFARGVGRYVNAVFVKPISFINPFGVSQKAKDLIIKRAQKLSDLVARSSTTNPLAAQLAGHAPIINTFDDALEYLIRASNYNLVPGTFGPLGIQALKLNSIGGLNSLLVSAGGRFAALRSNVIAHGYLNGSIVTLFQKIAQIITVGKYQAGNKLGEEFLKQVIIKQRGFGALGMSGLAPSLMSKTWLGSKIGVDILARGYSSITLPLAIGFTGGLVTSVLLAGADIIIDSAKFMYYSMLGSFSEDKNKLKKKKLLSPQDDNIFSPHPKQYMINVPKTTYGYWESLASGGSDWIDAMAKSSADLINHSTWGMINITNDSKLKELQLNPFTLVDKRLDVKYYENTFIVNGQTIWDILHECTLRHPGYIYGVRPYGNSLEYRVFFGVPSQRYWSKKISNNQIRKLNAIYTSLKDVNGSFLEEGDINKLFPRDLALYKKANPKVEKKKLKEFFTAKAYDYFIKKTKDRFVPFRQFHLVSSKRNLVSNNIIVSSHNMINAVSVNFINSRATFGGDDKKLSPTDWSPHLSKYGDKIETLRFRANKNISMNTLKEKTVSYRNIVGPSNAVRYGLGELLYGTRKMYEGSLTILGDTKINPWDVVILHDDVTNMYGPVEVCSVTHMMSFETGFITDVEVNALVTSNEELSHPILMQNLVYETRARIFDEYNSFNAMGNSAAEREKAVREIVEDEIEELIDETIASQGGFLRTQAGQGIAINPNNISDQKKRELVDGITEYVIKNYRRSDQANFLNDLVPEGATVPTELTDLIESAGGLGAAISGAFFGGEFLRRGLSRSNGLRILSNGHLKMGLFFASSLALSRSGDAINAALSSSYNSGDLGKNMFRQHILSRMDAGNIIQLYPLVKDGLPLVTGGFEEVDESEKWNNMLGYIYNSASSTIKGYVKRQQEMKAYGKRVIQSYDRGELESMKSSIIVNLSKAAGTVIGLDQSLSLLGYMYMDDD